MRALVADVNAVSRITLKRVLERNGIVVDEVRDELAALCMLYDDPKPDLVLLSLETVLADFDHVCAAMREVLPNVLLTAIVPVNRRSELTALVLQGADDFLFKPVNIPEAEARILAIQRALAARGVEIPEASLLRRTPHVVIPLDLPEPPPGGAFSAVPDDTAPDGGALADGPSEEAPEALSVSGLSKPPLEALLPEALPPEALPPEALHDDSLPPASSSAAPSEAMPAANLTQLLPGFDFFQGFSAVFNKIGLGPIHILPPHAQHPAPYYTAWAPLLVRRQEEAEWVNLRMDLDRDQAGRLLQHIRRRAGSSEPNLLALLQDMMGLVQEGMQRVMQRHGDLEIYLPIAPKALYAEFFPALGAMRSPGTRHRFLELAVADNVAMQLNVTVENVRLMERPLTGLRQLDVLAAPLSTSETQKLLGAGALLTEDYIQRILSFSHGPLLRRKIPIFRPPSGTAVFLNDLLQQT